MTRKKPLSEAAKERAAIVRWMRREALQYERVCGTQLARNISFVFRLAADRIRRQEHRE